MNTKFSKSCISIICQGRLDLIVLIFKKCNSRHDITTTILCKIVILQFPAFHWPILFPQHIKVVQRCKMSVKALNFSWDCLNKIIQ